jgi:hypothetical protein
MITKCEVCGNLLNDFTINLGAHPLCDDMTLINSPAISHNYLQKIWLCEICYTAHQLVQVPKEVLFTPKYRYRSSLTKDVLLGMNDLVDFAVSDLNLPINPKILDIGCNDGSLLKIFKSKLDCLTIGIDPTNSILESKSNIDLPIQSYFDENSALNVIEQVGKPDLITFTNVFAHIENLPQLLASLRILLHESTKIIIENHYLGSILQKGQFDTFYHEHPRTYSLSSFTYIAEILGLNIENISFPSRYGGNIRVVLSESKLFANLDSLLAQEKDFPIQFMKLQTYFDSWKLNGARVFSELTENGPIYGKALPGRAVMLISALGIDHKKMPAVFEQISSPKIGNYVPGTKIEIIPDSELLSRAGDRIIVWAWHIAPEVISYLSGIGYKGQVWVPLPEFKLFTTID